MQRSIKDELTTINCGNPPRRSYGYISRPVVVSLETKKKQHACMSPGLRDHYSELLIWVAALIFLKAVAQSLLLSLLQT